MYTRSDEALVSLLKEDNSLALETLFSRYYKELCQFCAVYTKDYVAAEEIIADLFIKIWDNRHTNNITQVKLYLFTSARNRSLNHVRRKKLHTDLIDDIAATKQVLADANSPFQIIAGKESAAEIHRLIDLLPARQREVLLLSRIDQIDKHEIAQMLDISVRTVETLLYQSTRELREMLRRSPNIRLGG